MIVKIKFWFIDKIFTLKDLLKIAIVNTDSIKSNITHFILFLPAFVHIHYFFKLIALNILWKNILYIQVITTHFSVFVTYFVWKI